MSGLYGWQRGDVWTISHDFVPFAVQTASLEAKTQQIFDGYVKGALGPVFGPPAVSTKDAAIGV